MADHRPSSGTYSASPTGEFDRIQPTDQHLGSFVVREGRWLVWHMYRRPT